MPVRHAPGRRHVARRGLQRHAPHLGDHARDVPGQSQAQVRPLGRVGHERDEGVGERLEPRGRPVQVELLVGQLQPRVLGVGDDPAPVDLPVHVPRAPRQGAQRRQVAHPAARGAPAPCRGRTTARGTRPRRARPARRRSGRSRSAGRRRRAPPRRSAACRGSGASRAWGEPLPGRRDGRARRRPGTRRRRARAAHGAGWIGGSCGHSSTPARPGDRGGRAARRRGRGSVTV